MTRSFNVIVLAFALLPLIVPITPTHAAPPVPTTVPVEWVGGARFNRWNQKNNWDERVVPNNTSAFAGTMNVPLTNDLEPRLFDEFTVITHAGFVESFDVMNLPGLGPGLAWRVDYNPNDLTLVVVPEPSTALLGGFVTIAATVCARRRRL